MPITTIAAVSFYITEPYIDTLSKLLQKPKKQKLTIAPGISETTRPLRAMAHSPVAIACFESIGLSASCTKSFTRARDHRSPAS
ncbi:uncharacterized protein MYCFIDRAFT_172973 [Pseudocercospora fijiensis CIRAD86]|uniref:Uncharacterized protein n=1 Tax=Pseudocercospora fijiensis (strain CIRAD86) TaxID=383855 RepID=M3AH55_PSEFD|nr:uncharacterized protein MYCFIDRAFT_172973 [Pseudocercospora fijiensis CIRAD86]EME83901.1 hypothetical protein MYCFIDRAFT_172973 [Pseudocercospora fijiensis CIRAD86]